MQLDTVHQVLSQAITQGLLRLDAQMLLLCALQRSTHDRAWLVSHSADALTPEQQQTFASFVQRRLAGEPVAYITGEREFFGLTLRVTPDVLDPRPDTEVLVEWALEVIPRSDAAPDEAPCVLDLGTGSGAIGLAIQSVRPNVKMTLVDASKAALDMACRNASSLGLAVIGLQSNWLENLPQNERFDVIVSNPPYIPEGDAHLAALAHEPRMALVSGADGLDAMRRIVQDAPHHLKGGGWLLLEHGYDQAHAVRELLRAQGFEHVTSRCDLAGTARCSGGKLK